MHGEHATFRHVPTIGRSINITKSDAADTPTANYSGVPPRRNSLSPDCSRFFAPPFPAHVLRRHNSVGSTDLPHMRIEAPINR